MLAVSQNFKDAIESETRNIKARITMKGVTYTNSDIFNVEYNSGSITGETFNIGSTFSNNIKVTFSSIIEELLLDDQVKLEFGVVLSDSTIEYVKMGTFFITSYDPQRNDFKTVIEASDKMIQLNGTYASELSYPSTIKKVALEIANKAGLLVNETSFARLSDMPINGPIGYTYRQALGLIAQFEGGFALFDRNGLLDIRMLGDPEYTVNPDSYFSKGLTKDETNYQIGGINCKVVTKDGDSSETTTLQSGSTSGAQISLENNVMTQTLLDGMYQKLRNLNYFPFSLSWRGNPALEAGDWITVVDLKGVRLKVPNLNYKLTFSGGIKATSSANTQTVSASSYQYQGSLQQQLIELNGRIGAAGNHVYDGLEEPVKPKEKDLWFKPNGPDTEIWIYQNGEWVFQVSTATNPEIAEAIEQAQTEVTEAKTAAQDAVDKANASVTAVQANTQLINDVNAIANASVAAVKENTQLITDVNAIANDAKSQAQTAATNAQTAVSNAGTAMSNSQIAQNNAGTAMSNAQTALDNYNNLTIGGRNFLLGTADPVVMIGNGGTNQIPKNIWFSKPTLADLDIAIGDGLYFSVDIEISGSNFSGIFRPRFGITAWINLTPDSANYSITKAEIIKWRIPLKVLNANWLSNSRVDFRLDDVPSTVTIKATNMKLERGTKYSDWSPAPEDTIVEITNIKGELNQKVSQANFNTLNGTVTNQATQINQNKNDIELRATKTDVDTVKGRVTSAEGSITTMAGQIALKSNKSEVDTLSGKVSTAEGAITTMAGQIKLKANQTDVDTVKGRVTSAEGSISLISGQVALKANQADVNTTNGKVSSLESSFTVQSGQISALNTKTDGQTTQIGKLESSYSGLTSTISSVKSDLDNMVIGGTNILATTTEEKSFQGNGAENQWGILSQLTKNSLADYGLKVGDKVTFSATCEISGSGFSGSMHPRLRTSWVDIQPQQITKAEKIRYNTTITMNESRLEGGFGIDFRADNVPSTVNMKWSNLKLEIGDKATYYSPAPEEKASQIQVTQMAQDLDGFKTTVANTYADKSTVASQITQSATAVTQNVQSWTNGKLNSYSTIQSTDSSIASAVASKADKSQITQLSDQITSTVTSLTNETLITTQMIQDTTLKHPNYPDMLMVEILVTNGESYTVSSNIPNRGTEAAAIADVWYLRLPETIPNSNIHGVFEGKSITLPALSNKIYIVFRSQSVVDKFVSGQYWVKVEVTPASKIQVSQLTQDLSGFKTTVANTYLSKSDASGTYAGKVLVASQINQSATAVTSDVQSWTNNKLTAYSTTQQTASSITNAVADKADKSQVTQLSNQITSTVTGITNESLFSTQMISSTTLKHPNYPDMPMVEVPVTNGESYTVTTNQPNEGTAAAPIAHVWFLRLPSTAPNSAIHGVYSGNSVTLPAMSDKIYIVFRSQAIADRFISGKYWVKVTKTPASQSQITQLSTDINLRVSKGDVTSQINIEAGRTLIDTKQLLLNANNVKFSGSAFIPNSVIQNLSADKITAGTLNAANVNVINLNAKSLTAGVISGNNLSLNLDTGAVQFTKGYIEGAGGGIRFDLDNNYFQSLNSQSDGFIVKNGTFEFYSSFMTAQKNKMGTLSLDILNDGILFKGKKGFTIATDNFEGRLSGITSNITASGKMISLMGNGGKASIDIGGGFGGANGIGFIGNSGFMGNLSVTGSKNAIHVTRDGVRATPAYEMTESYLGDIGGNYTREDCEIWVEIDPLFSDTVNTDIAYEVFLQAYDNARFWVAEFKSDKFLIKSDKPMARFAWEIKAKRRGYESDRLVIQEGVDNKILLEACSEGIFKGDSEDE